MIRQLLGLVALVVSGAGAYESVPSPAGSSILTPATDTVRVAPPTGAAATDRASILAAVDKLEPAGTLQFAAGTYLVGERVRVPVPRRHDPGPPRGHYAPRLRPGRAREPARLPGFP